MEYEYERYGYFGYSVYINKIVYYIYFLLCVNLLIL